MLLHLMRRSWNVKLASSSKCNFPKSLFSYWMASGMNLSAKPGMIIRMAGFFQIALKMSKMCSTQFHLAFLSVFYFFRKGCFHVNGLREMLLKQFQMRRSETNISKSLRLQWCIIWRGYPICFLVSYLFWSVYFYWHFNLK